MGFFSDLKEDLSQAVNELIPEEEQETNEEIISEETQAEETADESEASENEDAEAAELDELAAMLEQLEHEAEPENEAEFEEEAAEAADAEFTEELEEDADLEYIEEEEEESEAEPVEDEEIVEDEAAFDESEDVVAVEPVSAVMEEETGISKQNEREMRKMDEQVLDRGEAVMDEKSTIMEGMMITGDIVSRGSLDIIGTVTGNIDILGKLDVSGSIQGDSKAAEVYAENAKIVGEVNSQGSVKIGQSTVIIGNITATSAVIAGAIKGDIDVKGPVILDTSAIVMGNIKSKSVQINNGAVVEGLCSQCYADVNPSAFFDEFKKTAKA